MIRVIWIKRNKRTWNNEMEDANKLGIQAFHTWQDWFKAKNLYSSDNDPNDHPIAWHPPSVG